MGHNSLDEYWDTDQHSALNREEGNKPEPYLGPRGFLPRQDISCMLSGPILHNVHQNFAIAWLKETGEDLLACRDCDPSSKRLQFQSGTRLMMQLLRTQAQVGQPKTNPSTRMTWATMKHPFGISRAVTWWLPITSPSSST
ncbi:hypothetical protein GCM10009085_50850 [Pseudomonas avellanae]|nr:hypothetical protein GCM10009085_50850 [Pseudomonas avellanae]